MKILVLIAALIAALGLIFGLGIHGGDDPDPDDFSASDASEIAASLSYNYSGFFGDELYLADGETKAEATDFYPNGSSRGTGENYVTFKVLKDKATAESQFGDVKASYSAQIGKTVMGSPIVGTYAKGSLDDAIGYYNNLSSSSYLYYAGCYGNVLFESYFLLQGKAVSSVEVSRLADAVYDAIKNPVSVGLAKRYVEPMPEPQDDVTCRLLVYGNANMDNYLDQKDVDLIEMIAKSNWDAAKYPYADANVDGVVDQKDVDLAKRFVAGQSATMYYTDWNLNVSSIQYPLSGRIAGTYDSSLWFAQIVGVYDDVKYMCRTQAYIDALRSDMFPGASQNIVAQGSNGNFDPEKLVANNIKVVIGDPFGLSAEYLEKISKFSSSGIQNILIPENRDINGLNWSNSVVTLGVMFNKQDNTKEYVEYIEKVEKSIADSVSKATADEKDLTYLLIYAQPGSSGVGLDVHSTGTTQYGDVMNVENLPLKCAISNSPSNWVDSSVEDVLAIDPDVIIFTAWGPFQNNYTQEQYVEYINGELQPYKTSSAYKNGRVYSISYEIYGTLPGISGIPYLGSQIWPGLFDEDEGVAFLQEYVDKFTYISGTDVRTVPTLLPLTLAEIEGAVVSTDYGGTLQVYGNANMDSVLDSNDILYIQKVIGKELPATGLCDANQDGVIDKKDAAYVQDLIDRKDGTVVYYVGGAGTVAQATLPIEKIVAYGSSSAQLFCLALGLDSDTVIQYDTWPSTTPEGVDLVFQSFAGAGTVTSGSLDNFSDVVKDGLPDAVVITYQYASDPTVLAPYQRAGIDIIPIKGFEGAESADTALTLGYLLNRDAEARTYATWCDGILTELNSKLATLTEDQKPTALYWFGAQAVAGKGSASDILPYVGAVNLADWTEWYITITADNKDWILNYPSEYIFKTISQGLGYGATDEMRAIQFNNYGKLVTQHPAYKAGKFVLIDGNLPQIMRLAYVAEYLHPDLLGEGFADRWHQQLVGMYGLDYDVSKHIFLTTKDNLNGGTVVPPKGTDTLLTVLGNADLDNDIDSDDVKAIEYLVGISAKVSDYPYADANNDGRITSDDAAYVQAIVDKNTKTASKIFYYNVNGDVASVSQPVTKIGADYWPCMDGIVVLGAQDILTHVDSGIYGQLSSNAVKYKGFGQDKVVNFGSGFGSNYDFETVVATGVDAMVCGSKEIYFVGIEDRFTSSSSIDMIRLPFWEGDNVDSAVITLAYLLNNDKYIANAQKFLSFEEKMEAALDAGLSKVTDKKSCLVVYIGTATEKSLDVEIEARGCGSFEWSVLGGMNNLSADINTEGALNSASMYYQTDQDYVITKNPDYVFILGKAGFNRTADDAQSSFDAGSAYLTTTKSYQGNNIWVSGSGVTSGTMQKVLALVLACEVYGAQFSGVDYMGFLQEFVDGFTLANSGSQPGSADYFDVDEKGIWIYHPHN